MDVEEGQARGRTRWQTRNHDRNEVLCVALYPNTVFNEMCFFDRWSIHKSIRVHRKAFRAIKTAGVSSRTFIVKNISNSLTHCGLFVRLHFSIGCYDCRGLLDVVKVSISADFKSFFLIMRVDATVSTTNSLSSSLKFDGEGRHQFSESEKNAALFFFNFRMFLARLHAASRAHRSCHSESSWDRSSNFGAIGITLMRITWANHLKRWILVSNVTMTYDGFCELMFSVCLSSSAKSMQTTAAPHPEIRNTQMSCTFQHSHCTFVTILFLDLLLVCSSTWRCA